MQGKTWVKIWQREGSHGPILYVFALQVVRFLWCTEALLEEGLPAWRPSRLPPFENGRRFEMRYEHKRAAL